MKTSFLMQVRGLVFALSASLFLGGCASLFVSPYDAANYEKLTSLKAFHLKLLDDFTEGGGNVFDADKLKALADAGELKFREAEEYAAGRGDQSRVDGLKILHASFMSTCQTLMRDGKLYPAGPARTSRSIIAINYDKAIKGETVRASSQK